MMSVPGHMCMRNGNSRHAPCHAAHNVGTRHSSTSHAVPRHAMPCHAMPRPCPCHAMPCHAMPHVAPPPWLPSPRWAHVCHVAPYGNLLWRAARPRHLPCIQTPCRDCHPPRQIYLDGLGVSATSPRRAAQRGIQWRHTLNPGTPREVSGSQAGYSHSATCPDLSGLLRVNMRSTACMFRAAQRLHPESLHQPLFASLCVLLSPGGADLAGRAIRAGPAALRNPGRLVSP